MNATDTNGLVFDIQRFSLHDGPGIRTTIFLKGCPLNCAWCHNPEAKPYKQQLSFNENLCTSCMECVKVCNNTVHSFVNGKHNVNFDACELSGKCVEVCPSEALQIIGKEYSTNEIINIVLRDKKYFENSNGGLTISGGEPLAQFKFTKSLLMKAKDAGLHTAIETCGFAKEQQYLDILPYVDLFLYDIKAAEDKKHIEFTGASNKLILLNLDLLSNNGANIILRCPLIPGVNDSEEHLSFIAGLNKKYQNILKVEVMAFHNIGRDKSKNIGVEYKFNDKPNADENTKRMWIAKLEDYGCTNISIG
ncbi:glycyl-radical enzyme activating protein [Patescibacteria group bacterium]|nr:glycyl-radical enzyme activating protein [Patescibacteria group bacterium]MBU1449163.1 glycyl-radical enzyme activating protein [Patescibacteria group bacterium]MBU2493480.1 glycyl-radical enzyme activating protein [Bacteroidota bacterium]